MRPQWFKHSDIPYGEMWPDDILWYPLMLSNRYCDGFFKFEGLNKMIDYNLTEINQDKQSITQ